MGEWKKMEDISLRKEIVLGKLMELKANKSSGPDNLLPRVLKKITLEQN